MHSKGFVRVATVTPIIKVADCEYNKMQIIKTIEEVVESEVEIVVYPELCISGYTCGDLFFQDALLIEVEKSVKEICEYLVPYDMLVVIGAPIRLRGQVYNCAISINKGKIIGIVPKRYLPNANEFYEKRWFASGFNLNGNQIISYCGQEVLFGFEILFKHETYHELIVGIEICEDLWAPIPPSSFFCQGGATLILNPSASDDLVGKSEYRKTLVEQQSARCIVAYAYVSSGFGESSTDLVYGGHGLIYENGYLLKESERFKYTNTVTISDIDIQRITHDRIKSTPLREHLQNKEYKYEFLEFTTIDKEHQLIREVKSHPFIPDDIRGRNKSCKEIFNIQTMALAKRITHIGSYSMIIGISGGLDSTLALLVCAKTCDVLNIDRSNITAVTMPGFGTTDRTYNNAISLMKKLHVNIREISIKEASIQHFKDIEHDITNHNTTYENTQARERTQILMDIGNQLNGIVIGTGDLSELALGWATYNGDHMSMYAVNSGVPKTLVRYLVQWIADNDIESGVQEVLYDILNTPVSPELLPPDKEGNIAQKTEEVVGPYELHDFFLFNVIRYGYSPIKVFYLATIAFEMIYDKNTILKWLKNFYKRFFSQQFKRSCMPDGPKVGSISLSPRGDWRMPSDASNALWLKELDTIEL
ncbi:NAD(+) synthase [Alkalibaculum sp. M08DMB]|uniref:Glutamine-dependent NAD(+) synthetase n=1 Tax=Alkalibaculum sporogenes TaxID=2655001 RepID=A0A6A7KB13_9FIRM|nr:NAD(+) synthase [Alkalibaculum sporogenes]MPW26586.1 NAD(+) synthase [Alkalibaculum sporogenes]